MDQKLFRVTYMSYAPGPVEGDELEAILALSRRNNAANDLTGLLIFHENNYFQTLEGPRSAVMETYARILEDFRNVGNVTLERRQVERRLFAGWSMSFCGGDRLDEPLRNAFWDIHTLRQFCADAPASDEATLRMLEEFLMEFPELCESREASRKRTNEMPQDAG